MEEKNNVSPVTIIQIALRQYGLDAFRAFVDSYRRHAAGVPHDLIIALKGFQGAQEAAPFLALLDGLTFTPLYVPDSGLDIGTYLHIADTVPAESFLFFNSRTVIDAPEYAMKLLACLDQPGVGAVAASASWQSLSSHRRRTTHANPVLRPIWKMKGWVHFVGLLSRFPPYPNPHLRTNGLMIRRATLKLLTQWPIRTKMDAMRFESGRNSLSRQLERLNLEVRLVDREGRAWCAPDWRAAGVFWADGQYNLMIRDNQTERYAGGNAEDRKILESFAWDGPTTR